MIKQIVKKFIDGVPPGCIFDSHTVIRYIHKTNFNEYLTFAHNITPSGNYSATVHGQMAQLISPYEKKNIIERLPLKSWSETINDKFTDCVCWKKK